MTRTIEVLFVAALLADPAAARAQASAESRSIDVSGDAEIKVPPDEVVLTLGVETYGKQLDGAKADNDARVRGVLAAAKKSGVDPKNVQTDYVSIEPRYHLDNDGVSTLVQYFVRKNVVVTLKDPAKFDELLERAVESGANHVHDVQFRTTQLRQYRDQARALAIKAAREKAEALAGELGRKVGKPLSIQEGQAGWWSPYNSWWGSRWGMGMAQSQNVVSNAGGTSAPAEGTVALGQISVRATVTARFALE